MKHLFKGALFGLGIAITTFTTKAATAEDTPDPAPAPVLDATVANPQKPDGAPAAAPEARRNPRPGEPVSLGVKEVLKLADAGISREVLKAFANTVPLSGPLTAADVLALKQRSVPDEVTAAMLQRAVTSQHEDAPAPVPQQAPAAQAAAPGYMDPEGYEYFQSYYLYPRTLASVQGTLGIYPSSYPYSFGLYNPVPFGFYSYGPGFGHYSFPQHAFGGRGISHGPGFRRSYRERR
jgi:hypothetical protein